MSQFPFPSSVKPLKPPKRNMTASEILRRAAKIIADELVQKVASYQRSGGCAAISMAARQILQENYFTVKGKDKALSRAKVMFASLYSQPHAAYWFGSQMLKAQQEHRIIALLLCADMAESVGE